MDVEKRVSISAQMNSAPFKQGAEEVAQAAANMTGRVAQSSSQMGKSLLDNVGAFESLKRKFVEGYSEAQNYARAFQALSRAVAQGRDTFGLMPGILDAIERQYGLAGTRARDFAAAMMSAKKGSEEQQAALKGLVQVFQQLKQEETERIARQQAMTRYGHEEFTVPTAAEAAHSAEVARQARQRELTRYGSTPFGPITQAQAQAAMTGPLGAQQFGPITQAQAQAAMTGPPGALQSWPKSREELDAMRASIDKVFAASKAYEAELNTINSVSKQLNLTQAQQDVLLDQLNQRYAAHQQAAARTGNSLSGLTGTTHQQQFAFRQLGVQAIQTFQGFATGQPVFMTLIQQGHQVADVMIAAGVGVRQLGAAFGNFMRSLPAATGPILFVAELAAGLAALIITAERANEKVHELATTLRSGMEGDTTGAAEQVYRVSRQLAASTNISSADAFQAGGLIRRNPNFQGTDQQLASMITMANDLSKVLGTNVADATKLIVSGFDDAGAAAEKLYEQANRHFPGLDEAVIQEIKLTQATQGSGAAFEQLRAIIERASQGASRGGTALQEAWHRLVEQVTSSNGVINAAGTALGKLLAGLLEVVTKILEILQKIREYTPNLPESVRQGRLVIGSGSAASGNNLVGLRPVGASTGFQTFGAPEESIAAGVRQLQVNQTQHGIQTIADQIRRWAPPNENDTAAYIKFVGEKTGLDVNAPFNTRDQEMVRKVIGAIAQRETGRPIDDAIIQRGVQQAFTGAQPSPSGLVEGGQTLTDRTLEQQRQTLIYRRREIEGQIGEQQRQLDRQIADAEKRAREVAAGGGDPQQDKRFQELYRSAEQTAEAIRHLRSEETNAISEQDKLARSAEDANKALTAHAGAERDLAQVRQRFIETARDTNGGLVDEAALTRALAAEMVKLNAALRDTIEQQDLETNAINAQIAAMEQGGRFARHSAALEQANIASRQFGPMGSPQQRAAAAALTEAADRRAAADENARAAQSIADLKAENEQLQLQASLIGASTAEINRQTAALAERHRLGLAPGEKPNAEQQRAIDMAKQNADLQTQIEFTKQAYQEIEGVADHAFSSIGDAIVASFQEGADAAKIWKDAIGNILNDVIKEFMKLAILNPLMNALFGKTRPELGDLGGIFGGGGAGSGSGGGDLLGGLGKLIGGGGGSSDPVSTALNRGAGNPPGGSGGGSMDIFGKGIDAIFGKGFYEGGGLIGSLFGGGGGGGGGDLPGLYHAGGLVGRDVVPIRWLDASAFLNAPRYQTGLGNDEFAAILHRSERVLTANQNDRLEHVLGRVANGEPQRGGPNVVFHISTPDADSFRASQPQIHSRAVAAMNRTVQRNQTR